MDPYFEPVSRLLTALLEERGLREFRSYYFHNCIYDRVYKNGFLRTDESIPTADLFRQLDSRWKVVVVGDAAMHPAELMESFGNIDPRAETETPGIRWLMRIREHFDRSVWINPDAPSSWEMTHTTRIVKNLFPMYHLSVDGLGEAVSALVGARTAAA